MVNIKDQPGLEELLNLLSKGEHPNFLQVFSALNAISDLYVAPQSPNSCKLSPDLPQSRCAHCG